MRLNLHIDTPIQFDCFLQSEFNMPRLQDQAQKVPKYAHLAETLRQQIQTGELKPGDQVPSLSAMKAKYGISQATWEKTFSLLEEQGLVMRRPGQGTFITETQPAKQTGNLGFTGEAFRQPHWVPHPSHLLKGIQGVAEREAVHVLLLNNTPDLEWAKVDGLFLCDPDAAMVFRRAPESMPCVSLLMPLPGVSSVVVDEYEGSRAAAKHLLELGHRRIAYLQSSTHPQVRSRRQGYGAALREAGIEPEQGWVSDGIIAPDGLGNRERGRYIMEQWLQQGWDETGCTALVAQNDEAAIGAIEALRHANQNVPDDVSVIGFDGTELSDYCSPRLTTVQVPFEAIGAAATELLLNLINSGTTEPETIILPTTLRLGGSTAAPRR